ncbi:hypothetical protein CEXT_712401 [Caerostris extrusa]|uniref:Uncharacterized protein n=1 Tax=Caerostris extrusa TaxID=172846 RepID=A0AAV4U4C9_CAEEX|nr:hypothetical protein CEXT_712401 [Caerostris extrusa]
MSQEGRTDDQQHSSSGRHQEKKAAKHTLASIVVEKGAPANKNVKHFFCPDLISEMGVGRSLLTRRILWRATFWKCGDCWRFIKQVLCGGTTGGLDSIVNAGLLRGDSIWDRIWLFSLTVV